MIKMETKGPVFFKQERVGFHGRIFTMYKFRTMILHSAELKKELENRNEADGPVFKIKNDPRITKMGAFLRRTSLDEFPQFLNVLMGEMSVVGPRPPVPEEVALYERPQLRRLSVKPGITCIWQVSGRNQIGFDEWMKLDLQYIDNWSLKLDILLILKTINAIYRRTGY
ncbi:MAG: sugar transferase, partial [Bacteroidales bacterium]